jgi:hypothetical protein
MIELLEGDKPLHGSKCFFIIVDFISYLQIKETF